MTTRAGWLTAALLSAGCTVGGGNDRWQADGIRGVWANLGDGSIRATSEDRRTVLVTWEGGGVGRSASPEVAETSDGWLEIDAEGVIGGGDIEILVPLGITVEAFVDRGDVEIDLAAPADLTACVGAGSVLLEVPPGRYDLRLDGGVVAIDSELVDDGSAPHSLHACVGAGDITLRSG